MDKKNVQNPKPKILLPKKQGIVTIIEFYGLVTKKIILKTLA